MNKAEFTEALAKRLKKLKKDDRQHYLDYYVEMINDYMEDGCTEEEAIRHIGDPQQAADDILSEFDIIPAVQTSKSKKILMGTLLLLGFPLWGSLLLALLCLLLSGALLVLSAYIVIWCIPVCTGAFSAASLVVSVVSILGALPVGFQNPALGVVQLGTGLCMAGLFLLSGIVTGFISGFFVKMTVRFTKWLTSHFPKRKGVSYEL